MIDDQTCDVGVKFSNEGSVFLAENVWCGGMIVAVVENLVVGNIAAVRSSSRRVMCGTDPVGIPVFAPSAAVGLIFVLFLLIDGVRRWRGCSVVLIQVVILVVTATSIIHIVVIHFVTDVIGVGFPDQEVQVVVVSAKHDFEDYFKDFFIFWTSSMKTLLYLEELMAKNGMRACQGYTGLRLLFSSLSLSPFETS